MSDGQGRGCLAAWGVIMTAIKRRGKIGQGEELFLKGTWRKTQMPLYKEKVREGAGAVGGGRATCSGGKDSTLWYCQSLNINEGSWPSQVSGSTQGKLGLFTLRYKVWELVRKPGWRRSWRSPWVSKCKLDLRNFVFYTNCNPSQGFLIVDLQALSLWIYLKGSPDKKERMKKGGITVGADILTEHAWDGTMWVNWIPGMNVSYWGLYKDGSNERGTWAISF